LASLESDPQRALLLIRLAKDLRGKADEAEAEDVDAALDPLLTCATRENQVAGNRMDRH
jgi:hypothetical protein